MPRRARIVLPGIPYHITQRGNQRLPVFFTPDDRSLYQNLLHNQSVIHGMEILAYSLMTNHVHFIAVPKHVTTFANVFRTVNSSYSRLINERLDGCGHLWQRRFFSCPLDEPYMWAAIRYAEVNAVRAGMVATAEDYRWSSAAAHINHQPDILLTQDKYWLMVLGKCSTWREWLNAHNDAEITEIRKNARQNAPCGDEDFIESMEEFSGRKLAFRSQGRPKKVSVPFFK